MTQARTTLAWAPLLNLDAQRSGTLHERLTRAIREAIRDGRLARGAALPPSRTLAADLGVSRWAVTRAYGQLATEGYLVSRTGSVTRVLWSPDPGRDRTTHPAASGEDAPPRYDLTVCTPDYRAFPRRKWVDAIRSTAETAPFNQLSYAAAGGEPTLRALLADQLNRSRGADAEPGMVLVFTGASQAMAQVCRALYLPGYRQIGAENRRHQAQKTERDGGEKNSLHCYPLSNCSDEMSGDPSRRDFSRIRNE